MASSAQDRPQPTVFISYAHESDELRRSVRELAGWLGQQGCTVLTDHAYVHRPPQEGWLAWMLGCIAQAGTVLVVCTPKLKGRYEKTAAPDSGRGATYEGAIVTQHIYDDAMRNTKFFPILPDGGGESDIPTFLKPWWNGHRFPSGNEGNRCMIFNERPSTNWSATAPLAGTESAAAAQRFACQHEQLAAEKLGAAAAQKFLGALQVEYRKRFEADPPPDAAAMVHWFAARDSAEVQQLFYLVRRALDSLPPARQEDLERKAAEEAAVALYSLAAMRLVDAAVAHANEVRPGNYLLYVPRSDRVICAIIATALFGGKLHLKPVDASGVLQPEYVFDVPVAASGDHVTEAFERAAYTAVFQNNIDAPDKFQDAAPLTRAERMLLEARIDDIKDQQRSIALDVHGLKQVEAAAGLANEQKIPVMLPATEVPTTDFTAKLLGMDADRLIAELAELSRRLVVRPGSRPQPESAPSP